MRISDWSSDVCSSDLEGRQGQEGGALHDRREGGAIGMEVSTELDRNTLVALLDRMIRAEALGDAPPQAERGDWMFGSVDPTEFTEPDEHGWMAIVPSSLPRLWIPRALCFWRLVVSIGGTISRSEAPTSDLQSLMRI